MKVRVLVAWRSISSYVLFFVSIKILLSCQRPEDVIYFLRYLVAVLRGVMPWSVSYHWPGRFFVVLHFLLWYTGRRKEVKLWKIKKSYVQTAGIQIVVKMIRIVLIAVLL
nr:MAG TPA: hypothetical protein [Caudoviricetes sp.]